MLRIATIDDLDICVTLGMKFANSSPYAQYVTKADLTEFITGMINSSNEEHIILLMDDYAMLAISVVPFSFGPMRMATERAWWVNPENRDKKIGKELKEAAEFWAQKVGCTLMIMATLNEELGKYYEKDGYVLAERAYIKVL